MASKGPQRHRRTSKHECKMLLSLKDSHAKAASRRPQSGLKVLHDFKPQPLKYCFRLRILMQRRPQGGLKVASKVPQRHRRTSKHKRKIRISLEDSHAKATSTRPHSGLNGAAGHQSPTANMCVPLEDSQHVAVSKRPQSSLKAD